MDNFRGGNFIVGTDVKADESRRMANELFRNQNENYRMANENTRAEATITNKNSFFTQIGLFVMVIVVIIILLVIAILAYEKATNNQSLVNLNNLRDLTLSNLTVNDTSTLKTLTLSGDTTSSGSATYSGELNVTGAVDFDNKLDVASGLSVSGGLSVDGETNLYDDLRVYEGVSIDGGLSVGGEVNLYETTRIQKTAAVRISDDDFDTNLPGLSTTGYQLTKLDSGKLFFVPQNYDGNSSNIRFNLPTLTENDVGLGFNYKFMWSTGVSSGEEKTFILNSPSSGSFNKLHGLINLSVLGNSDKRFSIAVGDIPDSLSSSRNLGLCGSIYEGSKINCYSNGYDWYIEGDIGISSFDGEATLTNYSGVSGEQAGVSSQYYFYA